MITFGSGYLRLDTALGTKPVSYYFNTDKIQHYQIEPTRAVFRFESGDTFEVKPHRTANMQDLVRETDYASHDAQKMRIECEEIKQISAGGNNIKFIS